MASEMIVKARVLASLHHEGVNYKPDDVISVAPNVMK